MKKSQNEDGYSKNCIDCRFCEKPHGRHGEYICTRPIGESFVTGKERGLMQPCEHERSSVCYGCGMDAKFFMPVDKTQKKSILGRIKAFFRRGTE